MPVPQDYPAPQGVPVPRAVATPRIVAAAEAVATPKAVRVPRVVARLSVSKGTEDLGPMDMATIKTKLEKGEITLEDHFFDTKLNEWMPLKGHPEFIVVGKATDG